MNIADNIDSEETSEKAQEGAILVEYNNDEAYSSALQHFKSELAKQIDFTKESTDWREIRKRLTDLKDRLKALFFKDEDNNSFLELINEALEATNNRQNEEHSQYEQEVKQNYDSVIDIVKEAFDFAKENIDFKEARDKLLAAQEKFKDLKLKRSQRDELYKFIQDGIKIVGERQDAERENYEMECIENYHNLKGKIDTAVEFSKNSKIFADSRKALIDVQAQIKSLKLKRERRDELYQSIRDAFDSVNSRQEELRKVTSREITENYESTRKFVDDAIEFAKVSEEYSLSRDRLIEAQNYIKRTKLRHEQRNKLYADIRAIFEDINSKQSLERSEYDEESNQNYHDLTEKVNDCFGLVHGLTEFNMIRESLITVQSEVKVSKLKREQRNELFARIREAFSVFDKKRNEYFDNLKESKLQKLNHLKSNFEDKANRLTSEINAETELLEQNKAKLNDNSLDDSAKGEIEQKILNIENKIKDKEENLAQTHDKMTNINDEIAKL